MGTAAVFAVVLVVPSTGANARAAPAGADLMVNIGVANTLTVNFPAVPNGGSATVTRPTFIGGFFVDLINLEAGRSTVRFELGPGLRWGADGTDPTERCTKTQAAKECLVPQLIPEIGQNGIGWGWEIIADAAGSYSLSASIIDADTPDPDLSNNSSRVTVIVSPSSGGGGGGGGSEGGAASVAASSVSLAPARPKAGGVFRAVVRITAGGAPVRPTRIACTGSIGATKVAGAARAASGTATCTFRTPTSAKGKTLRGSVAFTARGTRFTKRFAARLG